VRWQRTQTWIRPASAVPLGQPETAADLTTTAAEAAARSVFDLPSFVLGDEVYFGNDRLVLLRHALLKARAT
jgi:2-hydroxychromene-2-carboxylate isomerase